MTLFPAPATKRMNYQPLRRNPDWGTNVFHEPIKGNFVRTTSIPRGCCLRQTTLLFPYVVIRGQSDNSSTSQAERANVKQLPVICHLPRPDNLSDFRQQ